LTLRRDIAISAANEKKKELRKITTFFVTANIVIAVLILVFGLVEHFFPGGKSPVITDKVFIAAIGGVTLQAGAIILAAFKGLFAGK
jgi:hypothetical protein